MRTPVLIVSWTLVGWGAVFPSEARFLVLIMGTIHTYSILPVLLQQFEEDPVLMVPMYMCQMCF